jgi:hypothetical protein
MQPVLSNKTLINGDFEQELTLGWTRNVSALSYADEINRITDLDSDDDYELIIEKINPGHIKLLQTVDILSADLQFSVNANLRAIEYNPNASYWAAAAVCLRYLNTKDDLLGETRITHKSPHCPWQATSRLHIIDTPEADLWHAYSFNINDELLNLSGVQANEVKKIQVVFMAFAGGG